MFNPFDVKQILFELLPTHDGSCTAFTESLIPLLTSSNEELSLVKDRTAWQNEDPSAQKRAQLILAKLCDEGLSDEIELHFQCDEYDYSEERMVFVGVRVIDQLGGNTPFHAEEEE
ncbi:hypothetical protein BLNAU_19476 [Blattamonas nauphoetae]|uniref:Uncharacterized protein n=1 Tax=Blattamonas nauphoetae TaxID=2049346 RepID=A0ABQ9WLD2_9EUKA|nr:hypothetical protein BLNAU_24818 [Blattamonas nauphoetae]KAK2945621.1 hypothetical protein BLNAU_19476 [Blattamonas nauphoetae]